MVFPHPPALAIYIAVLLVLLFVGVTIVDVRERRIPNSMTGLAALGAVLSGLLYDEAGQPSRLIAAFAAVAFLLAVRAPRPAGLGLGDVKLAGVLGLCLGPVVAVALAVAFLAGSVVAAGVALRFGWRALRTTTVPFGPYLAGGGVVAFVVGQPLLNVYTGLLGS
ncbi:MAG: prepilin peptidase [Patulibacter sp.]|nr:prepilin peptidase [Patulibacter sp.]